MLKPVKKFLKKVPGVMALKYLRDDYIYRKHMNYNYDQIESFTDKVYFKMFNRHVNWDDPKSYNEKIQVSKIYNPTELKTRLADKYLVREWVKNKIGEKYLIPLIGVYDSFEEIDFKNLPDQFVIKCNHDSGSVILCKDKNKFNINSARKKINHALKNNFAWLWFEMHYKNIPPKIIIEKYMGDNINDYKFLCFDGKPYSCRIDIDRFNKNHSRSVYNMDWKLLPWMKGNYKTSECPKPENFDELKNLVIELCKDIDQIRVDVYVIDKKIYFGEMTFTNGSGLEEFYPDEWDFKIGELWKFDNTIRQKVREKNLKP